MSSFLFLHFCDDALWLLGLYFFEFILSELSSGGFLPLLHKPPQGPHSGPTGRVRSFPGVVSPTRPQNRTQCRTGASLVFLPKTSLPLPLKGEGLGIAFLGFACFRCSFTTGSYWPNRAGLELRWFVSLSRPQNRTQGHTGVSLVLAYWLAILRRITLPFGNSV